MAVPKIRFPGFTEDWEQRKLGDIVERITRKNTNNESDLPLTISAQYGLIDQNEFFDKRIASKDVSGYYLVKNGEFAYNKSTSNDAPWGAVKRLDRYKNGVVSTLYIVFSIRDSNTTDSDFLATYYDTDRWHSGIQAVAAEGARNHGLLNISASDFFNTTLKMPADIEEQRKIGAFFKEIDNTITLHQRKLESMKLLKKSLLQKMLPKSGETVPEVRFPGFTDAWEQRKLSGMATFSKGSGYSKADLKTSGKPIILYGRMYTKYETIIRNVDTFAEEKAGSVYSESGDVIVPASGETAQDISRASVVANSGILLGGDINIIHPNNELNPGFLALTISNGNQQKKLSMKAQGATIVHLHNEDLKGVDILCPSIDEQTLISEFFERIDNTITLHQRKVEILHKLKKSLLQQMFV